MIPSLDLGHQSSGFWENASSSEFSQSHDKTSHTCSIAPLPGIAQIMLLSPHLFMQTTFANRLLTITILTFLLQSYISYCFPERRLIVFIVQDIQINISIQILLSLLFRFYFILVIEKTISPGMCVDSCICIDLYLHTCNVSQTGCLVALI